MPFLRILCQWVIIFLAVASTVLSKGGGGQGSKAKMAGLTDRPKSKSQASSGGSSSSSGSASSRSSKADKLEELGDYRFRRGSHEERLREYLFSDYESIARAVSDVNKTVVVKIDFVLLRIHGLDERGQVLTTTGLIIAEWTDDRLTWNSTEFGDLTDMIVSANDVWLPELAVMNGAEELMPNFERIRVLLHSDGRLHWEPGGIFKTTCDIDIAYFPFDTQHCPLLIGAYSYYSHRMNITNASTKISTHDFRVNGEWHVYDTSAEWSITYLDTVGQRGYSHVVFRLHLKRRYKFYIMNIVLPCVMLSVLIMMNFCLPPEAGEKISLGISVLLAFTVFLLMIAESIPKTSSAIPLIVTYLMATMTLGTVSICLTVLVLNLHHRGSRYPVPTWLHRLCFVYMAPLIGLRTPYNTRRRSPGCITKLICWKRAGQPPTATSASTKPFPPPVPSTASYFLMPKRKSSALASTSGFPSSPTSSPVEPVWKRRLLRRRSPNWSATASGSGSGAAAPKRPRQHFPKSTDIPTSATNVVPISCWSSAATELMTSRTASLTGDNGGNMQRRKQLSERTSSRNDYCNGDVGIQVSSAADGCAYFVVGDSPPTTTTAGPTSKSNGIVANSAALSSIPLTAGGRTTAVTTSSTAAAPPRVDSLPLFTEKTTSNFASAEIDSKKRFRIRQTDECSEKYVGDNVARPAQRASRSVEYDTDDEGVTAGDDGVAKEWREVARVFDRLCFWILFLLMTASGFIILLYPKYTGNETDWDAPTDDVSPEKTR